MVSLGSKILWYEMNKGYQEYRDFARQELNDGYQRNPIISGLAEFGGALASPIKPFSGTPGAVENSAIVDTDQQMGNALWRATGLSTNCKTLVHTLCYQKPFFFRSSQSSGLITLTCSPHV